MKTLLKYLLLLFVAIVVDTSTDGCAREITDEKGVENNFCMETQEYSIVSPIESQLNIPRPTSVANTSRVQSTARRRYGAQRNNFEVTKAGKVENISVRYFTQNTLVITNSYRTESSCRLHFFGRLII